LKWFELSDEKILKWFLMSDLIGWIFTDVTSILPTKVQVQITFDVKSFVLSGHYFLFNFLHTILYLFLSTYLPFFQGFRSRTEAYTVWLEMEGYITAEENSSPCTNFFAPTFRRYFYWPWWIPWTCRIWTKQQCRMRCCSPRRSFRNHFRKQYDTSRYHWHGSRLCPKTAFFYFEF